LISLNETLDPKQLQWRCRRGVRELDVLFTRFLQDAYPNLSEAEQVDFQRLLDTQDPTIMDWLFAKQQPEDQGLLAIIIKLRNLSGLSA